MLVAIELGGLAAATAAHRSWQETSQLLDEAPPTELDQSGWLCLRRGQPSDAARLLALDVEMIERRSDGLRLPVKAALLLHELTETGIEGSRTLLFDGLIDASAVDDSWATDEAAWDYKTDITGLSFAQLASERDSAKPLAVLQALFSEALTATTFVVAHNLASDLKALRMHGACLRRRLIDTQALFSYANGVRAPLRALVESMLPAAEWGDFQARPRRPLALAPQAARVRRGCVPPKAMSVRN